MNQPISTAAKSSQTRPGMSTATTTTTSTSVPTTITSITIPKTPQKTEHFHNLMCHKFYPNNKKPNQYLIIHHEVYSILCKNGDPVKQLYPQPTTINPNHLATQTQQLPLTIPTTCQTTLTPPIITIDPLTTTVVMPLHNGYVK